MAKVDVPANPLDDLNKILVGGIVEAGQVFSKATDYDNFTGCITGTQHFLFLNIRLFVHYTFASSDLSQKT